MNELQLRLKELLGEGLLDTLEELVTVTLPNGDKQWDDKWYEFAEWAWEKHGWLISSLAYENIQDHPHLEKFIKYDYETRYVQPGYYIHMLCCLINITINT